MSVTPDDPARLPPHVRPPRHGGHGRLPIFELLSSNLGPSLMYRPDPNAPLRHGFVEPNKALAFDSYQKALYATQPNWTEVT
jgi:hypothetical protein